MPIRTILTFGYHDLASPRHWSVCEALRAEGTTFIECHTTARGFFLKYVDLRKQYRQKYKDTDAVLVTFPGHYLMPLAWLLTRMPRKQLIFDAFISLHDTSVSDRQVIARWSPRALGLFCLDWLSMHLADEVLVDTQAQRQFFIARFHLKPERVRTIYLQARPDLFHPDPSVQKPADRFEVFFYGTFIPLHGIEHILRAAAIVQARDPRVHFTLLGKGQTRSVMEQLHTELRLQNVTFQDFVPLAELPDLIRRAHLCLGIFGTSDKARRVIPHKVYDAVACGTPILTADSPAIQERFANHPLVRLCPAGNPEAIARAILKRSTQTK